MAKQNQLSKPKLTGISTEHAQFLSQLVDSVNSQMGYNGPAYVNNNLDVQGNPINNVADPKAAMDALNLQTADKKYSPAVVGPQLDVGGKSPLKGLTYLYLQKYVNQIIAGAGISISPASGTGKVTITATGGAAPNFVDDETVSGSGTSWTLAHAPAAGCVPILVVQVPLFGGVVLLKGQTPGFTISGANITTTSSYSAGALAAWYRY